MEPGKPPIVNEVRNDLDSMQRAVGGLLEPVYNRDGTILVVNEQGKLLGLDVNRRVGDDVIVGPFFVVGDNGEEFRSLTDAEVERYMERFAQPEEISQEKVEENSGFNFISM